MRLTPFDSADEISLRLSDLRDLRASESAIPSDERRMRFVPGADPLELTPIYRAADDDRVAGGQGHTDAELDRAYRILLWSLAIAAGLGLGATAARYVARFADAIGAWCVS